MSSGRGSRKSACRRSRSTAATDGGKSCGPSTTAPGASGSAARSSSTSRNRWRDVVRNQSSIRGGSASTHRSSIDSELNSVRGIRCSCTHVRASTT